MSEPVVIYQKKGRIAYITLNRPSKLNALNFEMATELGRIWRDFQNDDSLWTAILTGAGRAFCAGIDLGLLGNEDWLKKFPLCVPGLSSELDKPVIAAINSYCLAGGFFVAMFCDIKIAAEDAQFAVRESRVGFTIGGIPTLLRYIPRAIAMEMFLTGKYVDAQRAYEAGLVNAVVPSQQLVDEATKVAELINEGAPLVIRAWKKLMNKSYYPTLYERGVEYTQIFDVVRESEDAVEGARAFLEKRKPQFKGK